MKPRQQRMLAVGLVVGGLGVAAALAFQAFEENMMFFKSVSAVAEGDYPRDRNFRIGGLVVDGSVERKPEALDVSFRVTDLRCELPVTYSGVLPDLFREGQGVVAHGRLDESGVFVADRILAKHDENYMAPEVAESLQQHVSDQTEHLEDYSGDCEPR